MKRVFITRRIPSIAKELLEKQFEVVESPEDRRLGHEDLIQAVQEYDGILSMLSDPFTSTVLSYSTLLNVLSNYAIGLYNIDVTAAKEKGVSVYNLPDVVTESTADL